MGAADARVLVFGGTAEGRDLVEWLARHGVRVTACSATEYGGQLLPEDPNIESLVERLDEDAMVRLMKSAPYACVVDATHPYAPVVTANVKAAAGRAGLSRLRVVRPEGDLEGVVRVGSVEEAARYLAGTQGHVLLTTGSKDLATFAQLVPDFAERLYPRILPVEESLSNARGLGFAVDHIIAMQGPFTQKVNVALMEMFAIRVMVTKDSGATGGFADKVEAARAVGATCVVVGRPLHEEGLTADQVKQDLVERLGL